MINECRRKTEQKEVAHVAESTARGGDKDKEEECQHSRQ